MLKKVFLLFALILLSQRLEATDKSDFLLYGTLAWNQDLKAMQGRYQMAYSFWDDFSLGLSYEHTKYFAAPGAGFTWHLEPFEIITHAGPLFWDRDGEKRTFFQVSLYAYYLMQFTTHFQFVLSAGVNLPDKRFRGVPLGAGFRYWF